VAAIEDLLRDAFQADALTVRAGDMPPLATPPSRRAGRSMSGLLLNSRFAIPLAAAVAVVTVVLAAELVMPRLVAGRETAGAPLSPQLRSTLFGAPDARQPPYLVGGYDSSGLGADIGVYSARTGRMLSHLRPPRPHLFFDATAATADDLSFVVAAEPRSGSCVTWLYRLTLTRTGKVASLAPLRVPEVAGEIIPPSGLSASASGQTIAYTANGCGQGDGWLGVIDVASGSVRTWKADAEDLLSLSLSANGQHVLYVNSTVYGGDGSVQMLQTRARPGSLARRARIVVPGAAGVGANGSVALTTDGTTVLACTESGGSGSHTATLSALTASTGRPLGIVHRWEDVTVAPCTIDAVPATDYLLVSDISGAMAIRINLATGQTWQIPGRGQNPPSGISW
jgi:hypothetical protein